MTNERPTAEIYRQMTEKALEERIGAAVTPQPLWDAMRYSLLSGGKRLRAALLLEACRMLGGAPEQALIWACAIEMIHASSLIHDDMPAMDDDDMRRGKPACHKVYGDGMALLAGDGLLTLAFREMAEASGTPDQIRATRCLVQGCYGMISGQCEDLRCERERTGGQAELSYIHEHKTADMLIGAVTAGMCLAGGTEADLKAGRAYGLGLGMAFQIKDDLLDVEGDPAVLGKQTGMDAARGKLTWVTLNGVEASRRAVREWTDRAVEALEPYGEQAGFLRQTALSLVGRSR